MKYNQAVFSCITVFLCLLFCFLFSPSTSSLTYQSSVGVNFTFNSALNVSLSGNLVINNLTPGSSSDSNVIDVSVSTNASYGYVLSATVGQKNGTSSLVNSTSSSNTFTNLNANKASLSNFTDNTWGYSYSVDDGTNWISGSTGSTSSGYNGLPLDNNDNAEERGKGGITLISTDNPLDNQSIKFKIGAKASTSQPAGTYTNTINFYAVANPEPTLGPVACTGGKICYNSNTLEESIDAAQGEMGQQDASNNANVTLYAPNFKREGYGFAGWNTSFDYTGTYYGPNQTITTPADTSTNGLSLYAVWVPSAGDLQNWSGCSSLAKGSVTALKDSRDNNVYAVAKLADNKCWMIENLRLDNTPELSSTNTHNPSLPLTNTWWFSTDNDSDTKPTSSHLSSTTNPTQTAWCYSNSSACDDQSMLATNNTTLFANNTASSYSASSNVYSYGNYYNWYSATGGNGKLGSGYSNGYHSPGDICPAGWHLPKGGNKANEANNEFWSLIVTGLNNGVNPANYDSSTYPYYDGTEATPVSNALRSYPNNFVYSGYVNGSSVNNRDYSGDYWPASGYNNLDAYTMYFYSARVHPGTYNNNKFNGRMVRCLSSV